MPTTAVASSIGSLVAAITMPYQNFLNELAKSVQVYGTALATIVLVVCAFGYMGAKGLSPQNASRWLGGMFAAIFAAIICVGAPSLITIVQGWAANAA
jgi:hypothetical protein